jgi:site-specific recombinase XerD
VTSPRIEDLAASFRRHLRAAKKAERTITLYGQSIRFYCVWLAAEGRPATLDQFTRHSVAAWLEHLSTQGNEASTMATRLRGLRRFGRWLVAEGELDKAPTEGLEMPNGTGKLPRVLSDDELARILKACAVPRAKGGVFDWRIFDGRRDEVIVRLLVDCGLRVSELAGIDLARPIDDDTTTSDLDLDREMVYVVGKGNRPRAVPFGARTAQAVDRYLRIRSAHPRSRDSFRLLLGQRGAMSPDGIRWRVELLGQAAGVDGLHPHSFRHTFCDRWLADGGQERDLMHLAGWRSDSMLQVYARTTAVKRAHAAHRRRALGDRL